MVLFEIVMHAQKLSVLAVISHALDFVLKNVILQETRSVHSCKGKQILNYGNGRFVWTWSLGFYKEQENNQITKMHY